MSAVVAVRASVPVHPGATLMALARVEADASPGIRCSLGPGGSWSSRSSGLVQGSGRRGSPIGAEW